jgi:hypothetical protein
MPARYLYCNRYTYPGNTLIFQQTYQELYSFTFNYLYL